MVFLQNLGRLTRIFGSVDTLEFILINFHFEDNTWYLHFLLGYNVGKVDYNIVQSKSGEFFLVNIFSHGERVPIKITRRRDIMTSYESIMLVLEKEGQRQAIHAKLEILGRAGEITYFNTTEFGGTVHMTDKLLAFSANGPKGVVASTVLDLINSKGYELIDLRLPATTKDFYPILVKINRAAKNAEIISFHKNTNISPAAQFELYYQGSVSFIDFFSF
ncbi:uncharacterized protein LOC118433445 isoform X1 [Folsomia candida]|uniref:uncharacterized protein LOC118433445 isoform X1 n=1 Tax=Folsomia candida TaxID=158441 RepID=UPI0016051459|nr:uncharacterized protein LOC118433445 isoform X1 [Folsomia candida]XP_035701268.1 uncharacterized protein LOC118433445 isoform X1 [Folsomia candida]